MNNKSIPFTGNSLYYEAILSHIANVFQIWLTLAGYEQLAEGFEQTREGEIFWKSIYKVN